nr:elicitin-like protein [Pythium porphyrae]
MRLVRLVLAVLAASPLLLTVAAQEGTVHAADTGSSDAPAPGTTEYVPAEIPVATEDSETFRKVPNVVCSQEVLDLVSIIYSKNRELFDVCAEKSKYQIFPFSGKQPTPEQIHALATTKACTALFTACVLANLTQCDISGLGLKAVTESLLKITVDVDEGRPSPDTDRFHELHIWRRDVNLAQAAGEPFGNDSPLYMEYTTNLWRALTKYNVRVQSDLSIIYNLSDLSSTVNGTNLDNSPDAMESNNSKTGDSPSSGGVTASEGNASGSTSGVRDKHTGGYWSAILTASVAVLMAELW